MISLGRVIAALAVAVIVSWGSPTFALVGCGTNFLSPFGIAIEADGNLVVADPGLEAVVRVDPVSGNRTVLGDPTQTILGLKMKVKNPSGDPLKRSIVAKAREKGSDNIIIGDPTVCGGSLEVIANGTTPSSQTFSLPQGTDAKGKPFWRAVGSRGFKYFDGKGEQGAVKRVKITKSASNKFKIKVELRGKNGSLTVVPPNVGTDGGFVLEIEGGGKYCVNFGTESSSKDRSDRLWKIKNPTAESCPVATTD